MYVHLFKPGAEPQVWDIDKNWPGLINLPRTPDTYIYFHEWKKWHRLEKEGDPQVDPSEVPSEYRAYILLIT